MGRDTFFSKPLPEDAATVLVAENKLWITDAVLENEALGMKAIAYTLES